MNFGERLKQIRTEKGLTQPQFAQLAGIEQSYLSKLENDKSVPSAEMFSTLLAGLEMDEATFLQEVGKEALATLRHIPAVSSFQTQAVAAQVTQSKHWLYGSSLAWVLGFALMLAANDGIFFPNKLYKYTSAGIILPGEAENVFDSYREILGLRLAAGILDVQGMSKEMAAFQASRVRPLTVESPANRGTVYFEQAAEGRRRFDLIHTQHVQAPGNRILHYLGAIVLFCGFIGLFIEWRLRRLKKQTSFTTK